MPEPDCIVLGAVEVGHGGDGVVVDGVLGVEDIVQVVWLKGHSVGVRVLPLLLGIDFGLNSLLQTAPMAALQLRSVAEENRLWSRSVHSVGLTRPLPGLERATLLDPHNLSLHTRSTNL